MREVVWELLYMQVRMLYVKYSTATLKIKSLYLSVINNHSVRLNKN